MFAKEKKPGKRIVCFVVVLAMLLSGCGMTGNGIQKASESQDADSLKIGLVTGEGGIDDPYYQKAWEGLQKAEQDLKVGIGYVKAKNPKDYPSKLTELRKENYDVIFTIGPDAVPAVLEAAKQDSKTKYICLESSLDSPVPANVLGISYKVEEAAFLAGYLSGKMTKSRVVGFISGDNKDPSLRYYYGFKAGLRYASSSSELMKGVAGTFTKKDRVEEIAQRMLESKADVIFHVAGIAGKSMIKVMDKAGKYSIGTDVDQSSLAPKSVLTSVIKNNDEVSYEIIKQVKAKSLVLGKNSVYGLAENGVGLAETAKDIIPVDTYNRMNEQKDKIIAGKLTIPSTENEYLSFTDN